MQTDINVTVDDPLAEAPAAIEGMREAAANCGKDRPDIAARLLIGAAIIEGLKARMTKADGWRSALTDKPAESDGPVVLVFTGDAYAVEYSDDVNAVEHIAWHRITPCASVSNRSFG